MIKVFKHKKAIMISTIILVTLGICYLIGQNIVLPKRMKANGYLDINGKVPEYSIMENFNSFSLGRQKDMDVLGGKSIGLVELTKDNSDLPDKWLGKLVFMTPKTSMAKQIKFESNYNKVTFKYAMYPTISKEISDGAKIVVELYEDENKKPILRKVYEVSPEEDYRKVELDVSEFKNKYLTLAISCDGGDNEDGDWVILKNLSISK